MAQSSDTETSPGLDLSDDSEGLDLPAPISGVKCKDGKIRHSAEVREFARSLFENGLGNKAIAVQTGISEKTISTWIYRHKWKNLAIPVPNEIGCRATLQIVAQQKTINPDSQRIRAKLSEELKKQVEMLGNTPIKRISNLTNTPKREGRTSLVKRITETAAMIYDWNGENQPGLIMVGEFEGTAPEEIQTTQSAAIDVQTAEATPQAIVVSADNPQ